MAPITRVLLVEDLPSDAELAAREVEKALGACEFRRVETRADFLAALAEFRPALIVSDFKLPAFDGMAALQIALERAPDVPFIILTGSMNEDTAVECMKAGAWDYVIKEHVKRLGPAVLGAFERRRARTERAQVAHALEASETRYRRLFEAAKDGILILDADTGKIVDVNPFMVESTGYSREEFLDKYLWEIGPFQDVAAAKASFADLQDREYSRYEDLPLKTRDGRQIDVEFVSNVYGVDGQRVIQCNIRDITARRRAEAKLRASEAALSDAMQLARAGHWEYDVASDRFTFNDSFYRIFRTTAEQAGGYQLSAAEYARRFVHPDDVAMVGAEVRAAIEAGDPAYSRQVEHRILYAGGEVGYITVRFFIEKDAHGRTVKTHGVNQDITARKLAEEQVRTSEQLLRTLVESMEDSVVTVDRAGRYTTVHARNLERLGFPVATFVGQTVAETLGPEAAAPHDAAHPRVMAGELVTYDWRLPVKGETRFMQSVASPLRDDQGQVVGAVRVSRDVTEDRKIHEQLLLSERMTSMGTLAAGVAHEINNPLAATMANLEFARRELEPLKAQVPGLVEALEALKDASETADRVRLIVRDLKVFSRADEEQRGPVDVRLVLESAVRMVWNEIRHRATLQRKYEDVPPVFANEARLGQVFLNLLVNAAQAIPEGHADANVIGLHVATDAAGRVVIEVRDTGAGVPPAVRDHVFEPFFTTKPVGVGTGLGLAICQRIATELGGDIALDSEVGQGTTVRVRLRAATAAAAVALPVPTPSSRHRGRVLVVDDEAPVARAIARALKTFHQVATVGSGQAALVTLRGGATFDVILCDLMMPEMTGAELHEALVRTAPETAAAMVFMTGGAFTPAAAAFLDRVPNERVEKPIDTKLLLELIERHLR